MQASTAPMTILCICSYYKGVDFIRAAKRGGHRVLFVTSESLAQADWPWDSIDETFYVPNPGDQWDMQNVIRGLNYVMRREAVDRIVALDDFDVERAALLREHFRIPGMGQTRARYFRDKLAMRLQAADAHLPAPRFTAVFNDEAVRRFTQQVPPPWVLKPRSEASATGIKKINSVDQLWAVFEKVGEERPLFLLEEFIEGDVYHVDSIIVEYETIFARAHRYLNTPMSVAHDGGLFRTYSLDPASAEGQALHAANQNLLRAFGLKKGVSHTEFIKAKRDGQFYFLETSARVGGAHIAEMVEAATGVNLWAEWAKLELLGPDQTYQLPTLRHDYAGIILSLARQEWPDTSAYHDPEVVWRMNKPQHAGLIVRAARQDRVLELLEAYTPRFYADFFASAPLPTRPTN